MMSMVDYARTVCGRYSYLEAHHIIKGRGKRRECETKESIVHLCADCHRGTYGVHGKGGHELDQCLRRLNVFGFPASPLQTHRTVMDITYL